MIFVKFLLRGSCVQLKIQFIFPFFGDSNAVGANEWSQVDWVVLSKPCFRNL